MDFRMLEFFIKRHSNSTVLLIFDLLACLWWLVVGWVLTCHTEGLDLYPYHQQGIQVLQDLRFTDSICIYSK